MGPTGCSDCSGFWGVGCPQCLGWSWGLGQADSGPECESHIEEVGCGLKKGNRPARGQGSEPARRAAKTLFCALPRD